MAATLSAAEPMMHRLRLGLDISRPLSLGAPRSAGSARPRGCKQLACWRPPRGARPGPSPEARRDHRASTAHQRTSPGVAGSPASHRAEASLRRSHDPDAPDGVGAGGAPCDPSHPGESRACPAGGSGSGPADQSSTAWTPPSPHMAAQSRRADKSAKPRFRVAFVVNPLPRDPAIATAKSSGRRLIGQVDIRRDRVQVPGAMLTAVRQGRANHRHMDRSGGLVQRRADTVYGWSKTVNRDFENERAIESMVSQLEGIAAGRAPTATATWLHSALTTPPPLGSLMTATEPAKSKWATTPATKPT